MGPQGHLWCLVNESILVLKRVRCADSAKGMGPGGLLGQWLLFHMPWKS